MAIWALNRVSRVLPQRTMEAATLADQFRDIQLKQQERLKARVAKLQTKPPLKQQLVVDAAASWPGVDDLCDDLGLLTATQERELGFGATLDRANNDKTIHTGDVEGEACHEGEGIKELGKEVEELKAENERLKSQLKSSEKRVEVVEKTLEREREALGGGPTAAQKIVELSKKNRLLNAELAGERNRVRQLEKAVRTAAQVQAQKSEREKVQVEEGVEEALKLQLGDVGEQLVQAKTKAADLNNQCQQLRHDLKMAQRVIAREVGEGVSVGSLLSRQSGWRGRSQQIIILQSKVSRLKSALGRGTVQSETCLGNNREGGGEEGRVKARQKAALEKIERGRRQNLETVRIELEKTRGECEHFRKECSALRARNKTLTEEVRSLKSGQAPIHKRNGESIDSMTLEQRAEKLEDTNRNLRLELQECRRALSCQSTTSEAHSTLPPLVRQQQQQNRHRHSRPHSRIKSDRQTLSAGTVGEVSSLREAQMMLRLAETERDRLAELTTTLQQRLTSAEEGLVRLKTERVVARPPIPLATRGGHHRKHANSATGGSNSERVVDLEAELAIQRDENSVLRETLAQLRQEKLESARLLHSRLQDTRRMATSYPPTAQHQ